MKNLFALIIMFSTQIAISQLIDKGGITNDEDRVYDTSSVDIQPTFPGGMEEFRKLWSNNFIAPSELTQRGKIIVSFIIERDGLVTNINVIRNLGFNTSEETIRVLGISGKWCPGERGGKPVRTLYTLPISILPNN